MNFDTMRLDHVGIRVTDLAVAESFYGKLGFVRDPGEYSPDAKACGLVHPTGMRIHLIFNGEAADDGNVLLGRTAADADASKHAAVSCQRHAPTNRGVAPTGYRKKRE